MSDIQTIKSDPNVYTLESSELKWINFTTMVNQDQKNSENMILILII